jgi:hypothetical protein
VTDEHLNHHARFLECYIPSTPPEHDQGRKELKILTENGVALTINDEIWIQVEVSLPSAIVLSTSE